MAFTVTEEALDVKVGAEELPVLSKVATKAMKMIDSGEATAKELENLVRVDPSLTTRILSVANSVLYGGKVKIISIDQAVVRLGMAELKTTIVLASTGEVFDGKDPNIQAIWKHAIATAIASSWLSERQKVGSPDECFVAGMLHDVGKIILFKQISAAYSALIDEAREEGVRFYQHERRFINYSSHEMIGARIGGRWGLDSKLLETIRFHHDVEENELILNRADPMVALVSLASLIAKSLGFGVENPELIDVAGCAPRKHLDISDQDLSSILDELPAIVEEQQSAFS